MLAIYTLPWLRNYWLGKFYSKACNFWFVSFFVNGSLKKYLKIKNKFSSNKFFLPDPHNVKNFQKFAVGNTDKHTHSAASFGEKDLFICSFLGSETINFFVPLRLSWFSNLFFTLVALILKTMDCDKKFLKGEDVIIKQCCQL